ncbi:unnamed protein product [Brachionus calyciflorus]|uniref:Uncharacterized protein n=1 Tax=Brachionus calyciflorus TaxID=104777 RepID=A0A814CX59_9BILA|nr:unnamed protein product [Brachionus calyciflorus]
MALIGIFVLLTPWTAASYVVKSVSLDGDYKIRDHPLFCEEKFLSYSKMVLLLTEFGLTGFLILALFIYFMWTHWAKKNIKIQMRKNVEQNSVNVLYTIMGDYIKIDKSNYKDSFFIPNNEEKFGVGIAQQNNSSYEKDKNLKEESSDQDTDKEPDSDDVNKENNATTSRSG